MAIRLEAITTRVEAIAIRLEAIAIRLEAFATETDMLRQGEALIKRHIHKG